MTMTPEEIYRNFTEGTPDPLQRAADEVREVAKEYGDLMDSFGAIQNRMSTAWAGEASGVASDKAHELWESLGSSVELLESCAQSHDAQTSAFRHAKDTVVPMPPEPTKPDVLEMVRVAFEHGPMAPFERMTDFQEAKEAHQVAARINNDAYETYRWASADNKDIPATYPHPVLTGDNSDNTITAISDGPRPPGPPGPPTGGGPPPGGGVPPGGGIGGPGGGIGGGIGDPGAADVAPLADDPSGPDLPPPPDSPPPGGWPPGVTAPSDAGPPVVHNPPPVTSFPDEPPPRNPPPVVPPVGGGVPGPGGRDPRGNFGNNSGDQSGATHAARTAGVGADVSSLGMPFGGVGDRAGADQFGSGSQVGRGAGGPGGGQAVPGSLGGGRGGGAGGMGMMPAGSANREEDKEHTRPEYLIEPDPEGLFGSDQSASSPVIGAAWKPARYDDE